MTLSRMLTVLAVLAGVGAPVTPSYAAEPEPERVRVYSSAEQRFDSFDALIEALAADADVVFVGEEHDDPATASMIEIWLDQTEKRTWFLFEAARGGSNDGH